MRKLRIAFFAIAVVMASVAYAQDVDVSIGGGDPAQNAEGGPAGQDGGQEGGGDQPESAGPDDAEITLTPPEDDDIIATDTEDAAPGPVEIDRFPPRQSVIEERNDSAALAAARSGIDTLRPALSGRYFGFGSGLSLGTIPLFAMWGSALPDSMSRLGIDRDFGKDSADTRDLRYEIVEAAEEFNFFVPFALSLYDINDRRAVSLSLHFFYNAKQFQAAVYPHLDEDDERRVTVYESMKFYSVSLEGAYHKAIPTAFFSVTGAQQAYLSMSLGVSPLQYFTRGGGLHNSAPDDDARMEAVADSLEKRFESLKFSANGLAASWRIGVSTIKSDDNGNGLELGLYYGGAYSWSFYREGRKIMNSDIHIGADEKDKPMAFISSRIEFKATYLMPTKKNRASKAGAPGGGKIEGAPDKKTSEDKSVTEELPDKEISDDNSEITESPDKDISQDNAVTEESPDKAVSEDNGGTEESPDDAVSGEGGGELIIKIR